jgi:CDP-diacylglycerol--glycerol-3-phosphate 3-phosphatidyltransferase
VTASMVVVLVALVLTLLSMIVFAAAFQRGYRDPDATRKGSSFLLGIGTFLVHWFMWALRPFERGLLRIGATPDHMNAAGLLFGLLSGVAIGLGRLEEGGWAILLAGACDVLDGRLARELQTASRYGKFIDSTLDRFVETLAFLGFAVYYARWLGGPLVVAAGLAGSLLVSYAQARGETVGVFGSGGLMQRAERLALTLLGCLFDPVLSRALGRREGTVLLAILTLIAVGSLATAAHRTLWIARRLRQ